MRSTWGAVPAALLALALIACASDAGRTAEPQVVETIEQHEWGEIFEDQNVAGTFAVREAGSGETLVWNSERAEDPQSPASTFKILNSMIILQTGVVTGVDELVAWDGVERWLDSWNQDHSLRSGIEVSALWMYQELARDVGTDRMKEWVTAADYGNADIGGGIDEFWLSGDLRISALEQLDFLERMVTGDLPFNAQVISDVSQILVREQGNGWSWSHKTGTVEAAESTLGWLVGTTEHAGERWVFAMNVDLDSTQPGTPLDPRARHNVARRILEEVEALPAM